MPARFRLSWGMNLETLPSVGARIPRIRVAGDPLCSGLGRGLLPTTSLIEDVRWLPCAVSSHFTEKVSARRDSPALGFTRRFASVGVAVQGMDGMEVCGRADETQDGAPVAS